MRLFETTVVSVLYVCIRLLSYTFAQSFSDKCITPNNQQGQCILLQACPAINDILKRKPVSREDAEYLRKSGCGFEKLDPKVCCPPSVPLPETPAPSTGELLPGLNICGASLANRIIGGDIADQGEYPWMALLEYQTRNGKGFYCGGVLINSRYVLTAAHCIKGKDLPATWRLTSVRLGEYNISSENDCMQVPGGVQCTLPPVDVPVEAQIAHEDYDPYDTNQYHDIGLLRLAEPVTFTNSVIPICLPQGDLLQNSFTGENMFVAGWGKTENRSSSDVILKLRIQVRDNSECIPTYRSVRVKIGDVQLCAGGLRGQDSCRGDSGGPLMQNINVKGEINYYALGIVSFGPSPCGMEGWPGVYTRVTKYVPWIISKLKP